VSRRQSPAAVEARITRARRRAGLPRDRLSLAARDEYKWNKIEHRLFSFITQNWRGKPLITHQVIVSLIAATTTKTGLSVRSRLDTRVYPKGRRVSDAQLAGVHLETACVPWRVELHHSPDVTAP